MRCQTSTGRDIFKRSQKQHAAQFGVKETAEGEGKMNGKRNKHNSAAFLPTWKANRESTVMPKPHGTAPYNTNLPRHHTQLCTLAPPQRRAWHGITSQLIIAVPWGALQRICSTPATAASHLRQSPPTHSFFFHRAARRVR
ncbi:hypothetical protein S40293_11029 [Stachybotrys chartarum IBT 40293]|nr:hypothetical protein S40293_11029 [Stachybotrys chartarum IBT 40293]